MTCVALERFYIVLDTMPKPYFNTDEFKLKPRAVKYLLIACSLMTLIIILSFVLANAYNQKTVLLQIRQDSELHIKQIQDSLKRYQYGLRGLRGSIVSHGDDNFNLNDLSKYYESRDLRIELPGARGIGIIRRVPHQELNTFIEENRNHDNPRFMLKQINNHTGDHAIIQYLLPLEGNKEAIGLDIASESNRHWAAKMSMRSGQATLSGPVTLVQATGEGQQAFLLLLPIYRDKQKLHSETDRINNCIAWTYSPLLIDEIFKTLPVELSLLKIQAVDITESPTAFYDSKPDLFLNEDTPSFITTTQIFGRNWQFHFSATPDYIEKNNPIHIPTMAGLEILFATLTIFITYLVSLSLQRKEQFQFQQKKLAAIVENSNDAIISRDLHGVVQSWNKGAESLFGYSEEEAIDRRLLDLIIPEDKHHEDAFILGTVKQGKKIDNLVTQRQTKSGFLIDVSIMVAPIVDSLGQITGVSKTIRDITQQKQLEHQLKAMNEEIQKKARTAESKLERTNQLLNDVLEASVEVAIIATDLDGMVMLFNPGAELMLGYRADEVIGVRNLIDFIPQDFLRQHGREIETKHESLVEGFQVLNFVPSKLGFETQAIAYKTKSGQKFYVSQSMAPIRDKARKISGFVAIAVNIHEQKTFEQEQRRILEERETLLREVYHRVKNNLQVIVSLFNMQIRSSKSDEVSDALKEAQQRVNSMALVHEKLYQSNSLSSISLKSYIEDLISYLITMVPANSQNVHTKVDMKNILIDLEKAVPLGLIINELLTNSFKYGRVDANPLVISIRAAVLDGQLSLEFHDNGPGFKELPDPKRSKSLGTKLIFSLVRQLSGEVQFENRDGAFIRFIIKLGNK